MWLNATRGSTAQQASSGEGTEGSETNTLDQASESTVASGSSSHQSAAISSGQDYENFEALWGGMRNSFKTKQTEGSKDLPGKNELENILKRGGDLNGRWTLKTEEWNDCKLGTEDKTQYCGFLELSHKGEDYKIKVGYDGAYQGGGKGKKQRLWQGIVIRKRGSTGLEWYSSSRGDWQDCNGMRNIAGRSSTQLNNLRDCENWSWNEHFKGKENNEKNFWGNFPGLSFGKRLSK